MVFSQVGKTIKQSIFLLYDSLCPADSGREKGDNRAKIVIHLLRNIIWGLSDPPPLCNTE